jgi:diguanylate cyclase (GGDEF)-like protein
LWFVQSVTEPARFSRVLGLAVWGLIAGVLMAIALDAWVASRASFTLVMVLMAASMVMVVLLIGVVWRKGDDPDVRLIALGFLPVLVMAAFPLARSFNLIPSGPLTRYGVTLGGALEMPILFYALSIRGVRRREGQLRAAALSRTDALTGLADARTLTQRLDDALSRAHGQKHACALLAVRIANFDALRQEYGNETGDRALVVAASHLRSAITDIDLAARVGIHEFALLIEGPTTAEVAVARAQQLVASGLRHSAALPPNLTLRFHVALALLPDREHDHGAAASVKWLIDGVNAIPPQSRKLIRPLNF